MGYKKKSTENTGKLTKNSIIFNIHINVSLFDTIHSKLV